MANNLYKGDYHTDWHIYILIVSKSSFALRNLIKDYVDKNWCELIFMRKKSLIFVS